MTPARRRTRVLTRALVGIALAAGVVAGSGVGVPTPARASGPAHPLASGRAIAADETDPALQVTLTSMAPGSIPRKGVLTLTGRVTNTSEETWQGVNLAPFASTEAITSRDALAEAVATTEEVAVGDRLIDARYNAAVGDLAPGGSAPFRLRLPVTAFGSTRAQGVYWVGVHALGTSSTGRDEVADGRARTFIPLVDPAVARRVTVPVSVVVPLRERVRRDATGRLNGPARWAALTGPTGRLSRLAGFGASAGSQPITWLVDPAVLDALADFAAGNPALSLGPAERTAKPGDPSTSPSSSGSADPSPSASGTPEPGAPTEDQRAAASSVLSRFVGAVRGGSVLSTGYADPDVAALARLRPSLLTRANALSTRRLEARDLTATPAVAPPDGVFDPELLPRLARDAVVLLSDGGQLDTPTAAREPSGLELVFGDSRASAGGPAPTRATDALALRQRVLSETALEALSPSRDGEPRPVTLTLPSAWNPGRDWPAAEFFATLTRAGWVRLAPLARAGSTTYAEPLPYPSDQRDEELGAANVEATRSLVRTGTVLGDLLDNDNDVEDRLSGAGLAASSYSARVAPRLAVDQARLLNDGVRSQMARVEVSGTDFVTLSGGSGYLTVTLVNNLEQPITVGLRAQTSSVDLRVQVPEPVRMQPGQRTSRRLEVVTTGPGVHDVTVFPVTTEGQDVGSSLTFSLRTSQVGRLIWYILGAGGTLLAVLIVRRIVLRIRNHRWREDPL